MRTAILTLLPLASAVHAGDILVPGDFSTIQAAIDAAAPAGDRVLVSAGAYSESNIDFRGKDVIVEGVDGPYATVLDAHHLGRVVLFVSGEGPGAVLDGFTIRRGQAPFGVDQVPFFPGPGGGPGGSGGGIFVDGASPTIRNCVIRDCAAGRGGNGGAGWSGAAGASGGTVGGPGAPGEPGSAGGVGGSGGGLWVANGSVELESCVFLGNQTGWGGQGGFGGSGGMGGSGLSGGDGGPGGTGGAGGAPGKGGGIAVGPFGNVRVANCTIVSNALGSPGAGGTGGSGGWGGSGGFGSGDFGPQGAPGATGPPGAGGGVATPTVDLVQNSIVFANQAPQLDGPLVVTFSNAPGPPAGMGNIEADPLFVDLAGGDVHIELDSPCLDAGNPYLIGLPATDFDDEPRIAGAGVDMGADEVAQQWPGTDFELLLSTWVDGLGHPNEPIKSAFGGSELVVELASPLGTFVGGLPILALQLHPIGTPIPPDPGLPGVHLNAGFPDFLLFYVWIDTPLGSTTLGTDGLSFQFELPGALSGEAIRIQGMVLHPLAKNGFYATSDAHEIEVH